MAKILVIDDEAELLDMMRLVLERRGGHETILSAEGPDGLAKAIADPPDMAIIDVMMPGVTGYDICRQLRANPATAHIPIIILTARAQPMDRDAAMEAGADAYLTKPVMMDELLEQVDGMLSERQGQGASTFAGTLVMMSLRGGVGATTLAVNLAALLAQAQGGSICLVDFCPSSGHAALQLGLRPDPNWSSLIDGAPLDAGGVISLLLQHHSGLQVLASPFFPVIGAGMSVEVAQAILQALRQQFEMVVVDGLSRLDDVTMMVLEEAAAVGLVFTADPPSLQTTIGTLRSLGRWEEKLALVLNQVVPGPQPPREALERTIKRPLTAVVPFDAEQARVLGRGAPLVLGNPDSALAQAVDELAQAIGRDMLAVGG